MRKRYVDRCFLRYHHRLRWQFARYGNELGRGWQRLGDGNEGRRVVNGVRHCNLQHSHCILLLFIVLLDFCATVLEPILRSSQFCGSDWRRFTNVDFVKRNAKHVCEVFLGVRARLRLLLEVSLQNIMLLFRETRLDFCADLKNGLRMRRRRRRLVWKTFHLVRPTKSERMRMRMRVRMRMPMPIGCG